MKNITTLCLTIALLWTTTLLAADKGASPVPATAKCAVCGMFVAKYPEWASTARFKDGTLSYYDGPKDMFNHYFNTARYTPGKQQADIITLTVKDYYSLTPLDAKTAYYVIGSDVSGPMGQELVPFRTEKDARAFKTDHKGKRIIRFAEVTPLSIK